MSISELLQDLFKTCLELNSSDYSVFFNYHGHVSSIDVKVSAGGWKVEVLPEIIFDTYVSEDAYFALEVMQAKEDLVEHHKQFRLNNPA